MTSLFLALLTLTATAQINYPFNPDENADAFISTPDLMEFLVVFGYEWEQEEIQVDSIPLSMYLSSLEAMIEASALPEGTNPGQFLVIVQLRPHGPRAFRRRVHPSRRVRRV